MEAALVGHAAETLRALLPKLQQKSAGSWRQTIEGSVRAWWKTLEDRAKQPAESVGLAPALHIAALPDQQFFDLIE